MKVPPAEASIRHIVILGAQPEWLSGLRGPMIRDFLARGYRVTAIGSLEMPSVRRKLESWGAQFEVVPVKRAGLNPLADLRFMYALYRTLRRLKPDLLLAYTVKPIVYGLPVARVAGISRRYAMITGRGYAFLEGNERSRKVARRLATVLYRNALRLADGVLFHNEDDLRLFRDTGMIGREARTTRIWGSGIDLHVHRPRPLPPVEGQAMHFLMIGRLIGDKGVREFAEAAKRVRQSHSGVRFVLVGPTDPSPNGVRAEELAAWQASGAVEYLGALDDVREEIAKCHVMVLPSYAEGLPRSVLEAMAAGRAVITTNAPGCADTVEDGVSGLLVPVRDVDALTAAMTRCLADPQFVENAGRRGLELARERFDVDKVNDAIAQFLGLEAPVAVVSPKPGV